MSTMLSSATFSMEMFPFVHCPKGNGDVSSIFPAVVLDRIKSFPRGTSCGRDGLRAQHLMDCLSGVVVAISDELVSSITQVVNLFLDGKCPNMLGEYIASAPLTPLVKPGGGIRPIVVGSVWRHLVSKVSTVMIGNSLNGYLDDLQFGVGVSGGGEAILHTVNRLSEVQNYNSTLLSPQSSFRWSDVSILMLLVDFKNAFNLVDREVMLKEVLLRCPTISRWVEFCYSNPARLYYGEHILRSCQGGDAKGLGFWPNKDPRSRLAGIFPPNIAQPLHGVKLLGGPASVDFDFSSELVMKKVAKTIVLMDTVARINDPQCELLLLRACAGISKLYFAMRTCSPRVFEMAQRSFDAALRSALERIVTAYGPGFASGTTFDDALCLFNTKIETDLLSNLSEIAAPKLMKKLADIYFTRVTQTAESTFSLSFRQMALLQSQMEDHTSD
ncbi:hypothetical protein Tco_1042508 [Tanacetum coccineum]|uniref:Reverse transcriptase domain-containing protein n=1 Tax=Tanacetum coccineum TaxID=301880 RepID=A0ABQ5GJX1_9ASTR